jgi:hypothetical protein
VENNESSTRIIYCGIITIEAYDIRGQKVQTLINQTLKKGNQVISWEGTDETNSNVSTGLYLCNLRIGDHVFTRKILLIR